MRRTGNAGRQDAKQVGRSHDADVAHPFLAHRHNVSAATIIGKTAAFRLHQVID